MHRLRTNRQILDVSFSPDGKRFAFTKENFVQVSPDHYVALVWKTDLVA